MKKAFRLEIILLILVLFVNGCWNRRDPEELAIVLSTGFDLDEEGMFHVIVQISNPMQLGGGMEEEGGGTGGEKRAFWVVSASGHTPFQALRNLPEGTTRELFWAHNRIVLFSENLARSGISPILNLLERERQFRLVARPIVVKGDLRKLMEAEYPLEETGARGLDLQISSILVQSAIFPPFFLYQLYNFLAQPGREIVIGTIEVLETGVEQEQSKSSNMNVPPGKMEGGAIFRGDQMLDWLTGEQILGYKYILNKAFTATFIVQSPDDEESLLSIEILEARSTLTPFVEGEDIRIGLSFQGNARIQDYYGKSDLKRENEFTRSLEKRTAEAIGNRMKDTIDKAQRLGSDVLGFGNLIYRKKPKTWTLLEEDWGAIFPEIVVDIDIEVTIKRIGLVDNPLEIW